MGTRRQTIRQRLLFGAIAAVLILGTLSVRAVWEGRSALSKGDDAAEANDPDGAIRWYRRAARWYLPFAPHVGRAYDKLEDLARAAEAQGKLDLATRAWTGVRSSVRATRSFYTPFEERLDEADKEIARLMAAIEVAPRPDKSDVAEREAWHYQALRKDHMPSVAWSIIALLGLALWIGGGFLFALKAVNDDDELVRPVAINAGVAVGLGLVIWLTGLYFA